MSRATWVRERSLFELSPPDSDSDNDPDGDSDSTSVVPNDDDAAKDATCSVVVWLASISVASLF